MSTWLNEFGRMRGLPGRIVEARNRIVGARKMARCLFCGKWSGLTRNVHPACQAQHDRAVEAIPTFFPKVMSSALPPDRFADLLNQVAESSFISADELRSLFITGLNRILEDIIKTRLPTAQEEKRIGELASAFGIELTDAPEVDDLLFKASLLRDLDSGVTPDRVDVAGAMPIELGAAETVLWVFNRTACFRSRPGAEASGTELDLDAPVGSGRGYCAPDKIDSGSTDKTKQKGQGAGDLIVTNMRICLVGRGKTRIIRLDRIKSLRVRSNSITVAVVEGTSGDFIFREPWFPANLIASATRLRRQQRRPATAGTGDLNSAEQDAGDEA
jgi:hypothetical protein